MAPSTPIFSPVTLIIRFPSSHPDITFPITQPHLTTTLSLAQEIRALLPAPASTCSLRLIHAGRALQPTVALSTSLRLTPLPASRAQSPSPSAKAKGKAKDPAIYGEPNEIILPFHSQPFYIHAILGDILSTSELSEINSAAKASVEALTIASSNSILGSAENDKTPSRNGTPIPEEESHDQTNTTAEDPPQGFDRLLTAGLTPLEVASLRSQFVAILAHSHTPDTMPSASELRELEERWLDNDTSNSIGGGGTGGGTLQDLNFGDDEQGGGLEDMLWGNIMGFFWPIGAAFWLLREEGVWSKRRQIAVITGLLVNLAFSLMRVL